MAKEVGLLRYVFRRVLWRLRTSISSKRISYLLPGGQRIMLPPGSPYAADIYCTQGYVDWGSEQLLLAYLKKQDSGAVCYDVGGNMGYYSVLLASAATRVFAFEPDERNHADFLAQDSPRITLVRVAVSDQCGTALFDVSGESTVGHLSRDSADAGNIVVETTTLDNFRQSRPAGERVFAIKIDIEGYEIQCLHGAAILVANDRPVLLIEFAIENRRPNSFSALGDFVGHHHYDIYAMIRTTAGWMSFDTTLQKTSAAALPAQDHKMLFLVPEENSFFREQCAAGYCFENMKNTHHSAL